MDPLDQSVLIAILVALIAYFTKGKLWGGDATNDAIEKMGSFGGNTSDLVATMKKNGKKAVVFYGSQTGTAEDYALKFAKEFQSKFKVPTMTADLADVSFENFENIQKEIPDFKLAAFFMATYGEGEPTDNAVEFFDYLENECENLDSLKFVCFGLGNSTYEFYNAIGKKTASKLAEKGAELVGELGLGDDGKGTMDEDYLSWKEQLFDVVKATFHLDEQAVKYEPSIQTTESSDLDISSSTVSLGEPNSSYVNPVTDEDKNSLRFGPFNHTHPYLAPIINTKELFNSKDRHCIHAEFDLSDTNLKYSTGDHVAIWPSNSNQKVSKFLNILGLEKKKDQVIELKSLDPTVHLPFPSPTTYDAVLRHYLEISGPVSRQFVKSISQFCPNEKTKHALLEISDDKDLFNKSVTNKYLNIADCLAMLSEGEPWKDVPFSFIIESVAKLQPRYYSISSSSSMEKQKIHITAVVEQEKPEGCDHYVTGVATNLLLNIKKEQHKDKDLELIETYDLEGPRNKFHSKLPIHIRRSTFKLPSNPATPVIMVGPGTGAAPFRGFIREKVKQVENGNKVGDILFFFGCRNSTEDFIYKEEWTEYSKKLDSKFSMVTAFSRETEKKVYVQDKILENSARVVQLLDQGAFLYVCGDASNMAKGVQQTLVKVYQTEKKVTEEIATNMIKQLRVNNRYQEDVW